MTKINKVLTVLLTSVTVVLLIGFVGSKSGYRSPAFAFFANWMVMSGVTMLDGVIKVASFLPPRYFKINEWEVTSGIYRVLGVRLFKRILVGGPFAMLNSAIRYNGDRASLAQLASNMRDAEAAHLLIFCIMVSFVLFAVVRGWWDSALWLLGFNVALNLYPIMLQRSNRGRLERIIKD